MGLLLKAEATHRPVIPPPIMTMSNFPTSHEICMIILAYLSDCSSTEC